MSHGAGSFRTHDMTRTGPSMHHVMRRPSLVARRSSLVPRRSSPPADSSVRRRGLLAALLAASVLLASPANAAVTTIERIEPPVGGVEHPDAHVLGYVSL